MAINSNGVVNGVSSSINGNGTAMAIASNGAVNGESKAVWSNGTADYTVMEASLGIPRHLRIITIGAGASGLNMARHVELHMTNVEHVIYEKNEDVGGTWFENRLLPSLSWFDHTIQGLTIYEDTLAARAIFRVIITNSHGNQIRSGQICKAIPN